MRKFLLLCLCGGFPVFAQFSRMATDYAGERLYFTTNLSQARSGQPDYGKLFIADAKGVRPLLIYNYVLLMDSTLYGSRAVLTNSYWVDQVSVSDNGAFISVAAESDCSGFQGGCPVGEQSTVYNAQGQVALTAAGRVIVSPNGTWALAVLDGLLGGETFVLRNVNTGASYPVPVSGTLANPWWAHGIADNGTAVIAYEDQLVMYSAPDHLQSMTLATFPRSIIQSAAIDAAGDVIVWDQTDMFGDSNLHTAQTSSLSNTVSLGIAGWADSHPFLSNDGSTILFLSEPTDKTIPPQVFLMSIDGTGRRAVTSEPEGIAQAVLSGNGGVVWAQTQTGRLLKFDLATGVRTQYTEPLAAFLNPFTSLYDPTFRLISYGNMTPGEVVSVAASVMPGERVEITVVSQRAPVVSVEPQRVVFQIPWAIQTNSGLSEAAVSIRKPDSRSWNGDTVYAIIQGSQPALTSAVHQDFSGLIVPAKPAQAGEIVHLFGTGFGPVTPTVPSGVPAPSSPLSQTTSPVPCVFWNQAGTNIGGADVLYSGLAPGTVGIYQLDVQLPDPLPAGKFIQVVCGFRGSNKAGILFPAGPAQNLRPGGGGLPD